MKELIKKILPISLYTKYMTLKNSVQIYIRYKKDRKRFSNESIDYSVKNDSLSNLRGSITLNYHNIEKGLSHGKKIRLGFSKSAISDLLNAMDEFVVRGYPAKDTRFQTAVSVLEQYVEIHKKNHYDVQYIEDKLKRYGKLLAINAGVKNIQYSKDYYPNTFKELMTNRHSVRDFGLEEIEKSKLIEALKISARTPSACNRQPWKVYIVSNEKINELLRLQAGINTHGKNIQYLMLITSDKGYYRWVNERNQNLIDGGLFSATLLYALESQGIASCPLHCSLSEKDEAKIRDILKIGSSEELINFIAIGSFPNEITVPVSHRDDYIDFTTFV